MFFSLLQQTLCDLFIQFLLLNPITIFLNQQSDNYRACNPAYHTLVHSNNTNEQCLMLPKSKLLFQHTTV